MTRGVRTSVRREGLLWSLSTWSQGHLSPYENTRHYIHLQLGPYRPHKYSMCRVHKPGVPRGPSSTPGLGPGKQHIFHGPAQKTKTQRARREVRSSTGRSTLKNRRPLVNFFGPPLRPEHSLQAPAVSKQSLQSEGLAQNAASYSDPATLTPRSGLMGSLLTALLRLMH